MYPLDFCDNKKNNNSKNKKKTTTTNMWVKIREAQWSRLGFGKPLCLEKNLTLFGRRQGVNCILQCQSDTLCKPIHPPQTLQDFFWISEKYVTLLCCLCYVWSSVIICSTRRGSLSGNINKGHFTSKKKKLLQGLPLNWHFYCFHGLDINWQYKCQFNYF